MHETINSSLLPERQVFSCPVCGGKLSRQLPSMKGTLEDPYFFPLNIRIVDSVILIARKFFHDRDEDDGNFSLENPHSVMAVIKAVFDSEGACTEFEILDVYTPDSLRDSLRVNDVKEVKI